MKKLLYMLLAAVLLTSTVAYARQGSDDPAGDDHGQNSGNDHSSVNTTSQSDDGLERISSPSEIRNFRDIVKRGKDMFGKRIASALEKIPSPGEIKNFEGIKKVGNSLWGYRRGAGSAMVSAEAKTCVAAAITKKDSASKAALNSFTDSTEVAIDARSSCQIAALNGASAMEQQKANMTCTASYQASMKTNLRTMATARDAAWKTYKTELKACSPAAEIKLEDGGDIESSIK